MIKTFRHASLAELWQTSRSAEIDARLHGQIMRCLDRLDAAVAAEDMNLPGFDFHPLHGNPVRYTVHISGPWCITFEFSSRCADRVDFQEYH